MIRKLVLRCLLAVGLLGVAFNLVRAFDSPTTSSAPPLPGAFDGAELRGDAVAIHMAPAEDLEAIDVATLDKAVHAIDLAAYVLTDAPVIDALSRAVDRGVAIRILFDREQLEYRPEVPALIALQDKRGPGGKAGVSVRVKRGRVLMHLKAYQVDGRILRLGSANFSASGLKQQDNEMALIDSRAAATRFRAIFDGLFAAGGGE